MVNDVSNENKTRLLNGMRWLLFENLATIARIEQKFNERELSHIHATDHSLYSHDLLR